MHMDDPIHVDGRGRFAVTGDDDHVRDLIEQVLFTSPGERVNRPDFGCGLLQLVFLPNSEPLASATRMTVQGALQRWLGDVIRVLEVDVEARDEQLRVEVAYERLVDGLQQRDVFRAGQP
jgi:phage baseplate assembly protein W